MINDLNPISTILSVENRELRNSLRTAIGKFFLPQSWQLLSFETGSQVEGMLTNPPDIVIMETGKKTTILNKNISIYELLKGYSPETEVSILTGAEEGHLRSSPAEIVTHDDLVNNSDMHNRLKVSLMQ